jgi:hypothetical protein
VGTPDGLRGYGRTLKRAGARFVSRTISLNQLVSRFTAGSFYPNGRPSSQGGPFAASSAYHAEQSRKITCRPRGYTIAAGCFSPCSNWVSWTVIAEIINQRRKSDSGHPLRSTYPGPSGSTRGSSPIIRACWRRGQSRPLQARSEQSQVGLYAGNPDNIRTQIRTPPSGSSFPPSVLLLLRHSILRLGPEEGHMEVSARFR